MGQALSAGIVPAIGAIGTNITGGIMAANQARTDGYIARQQAGIQAAQAEYQVTEAEINQRFAERDAKAVRLLGKQQANRQRSVGALLAAQRRAVSAAQGVEANTGSAAAVAKAVGVISEMDAITLETNAYRRAIGLDQEALTFGRRAQAARFFADEVRIAGAAAQEQAGFLANVRIGTTLSQAAFDSIKLGANYIPPDLFKDGKDEKK